MLGLNDTKVGDFQAISFDYNHENGMFHLEYEKLREDKNVNDENVEKFINEFYKNNFHSYPKFNDKNFFFQMLKDFLRDILVSIKGYFSRLKRINESNIFNYQTSKITIKRNTYPGDRENHD